MSETTPTADDSAVEPTEGTAPETAEATEVAQAAEAPASEQTTTEAATPTSAPEPAESAETPAPAAPATPRPTPRPMPRPVPSPAAIAQARPAEAAPLSVPDDAAEALAATAFGRVDDDGTVYVREGETERAVGQFPGVSPDEAMALYVRRFLEIQSKVALFEVRLGSADLAVKEIDQTLARLAEDLAEPSAVGDLAALRARLDGVRERAAQRRSELDAERTAARAAAVASRTAIVEAAEEIAGTDPSRIQWRPSGDRLRQLLDEWKTAQRNGPRIDRPTEESLWKRFSHARTTFDRERRHFFAELETRNSSAKSTKEALVAEAEALATSTDWGATAGAYRALMDQWKAAGRANRKDDDALWARFRGAQDRFFAARDADNAALDAEYESNLTVKEALLVEAEALLPVTDLGRAKAALRDIQERWEEAGKVPRNAMGRVEARLRAVETTIRDSEQAQWVRTNPETRARAEGAAAQLEESIAQLEADLEAARAKGDDRAVRTIDEAVTAKRAWLEQIVRAAQDARG
ncbi:DUF349 domain-containing protein [Sanguibacter sp. A247]|uniref:DUF349 domain-containing protein n=1 Tax=unclassified Sanguibacter TaxID=2645534 RepID=UPI003FD8D612